jgi:hypothetical protein
MTRTWKSLPLPAAALVALLGLQSTGCALLIGGAVAGGAAGGAASVEQGEQEHHSPMTYVGSVLANAVYFPAKVVLAAGGAVASGLTYVATLGEPEPTRTIWDASVEGDYVVTPRMIEGREDVDFIGPS